MFPNTPEIQSFPNQSEDSQTRKSWRCAICTSPNPMIQVPFLHLSTKNQKNKNCDYHYQKKFKKMNFMPQNILENKYFPNTLGCRDFVKKYSKSHFFRHENREGARPVPDFGRFVTSPNPIVQVLFLHLSTKNEKSKFVTIMKNKKIRKCISCARIWQNQGACLGIHF